MIKRKFISLTLALVLLLSAFCFNSCRSTEYDNATKISFKEALSYEYLKTLDGTPVTINGYMATSSPVDGSYIYLMNLPYQSCPFCLPNTSQLSNTMAVFAIPGQKFDYTEQAIKITGILKVSESEDKFFTDYYGYEFNFKITDAVYNVLDESELGDKSMWSSIAESDIITDIYSMYDYVYFSTHWYTYTMEFQGGADYLYDTDALTLITTDGYQFNYGYKNGYFDSVRAKVKAVSETELAGLIKMIDDAELLAKDAVAALQAGVGNETVFKKVYKESKEFKDTRWQFEYNSSELQDRYTACFNEFSTWMSSFEY